MENSKIVDAEAEDGASYRETLSNFGGYLSRDSSYGDQETRAMLERVLKNQEYIISRLIRVETRLFKLMQAEGVRPDGTIFRTDQSCTAVSSESPAAPVFLSRNGGNVLPFFLRESVMCFHLCETE